MNAKHLIANSIVLLIASQFVGCANLEKQWESRGEKHSGAVILSPQAQAKLVKKGTSLRIRFSKRVAENYDPIAEKGLSGGIPVALRESLKKGFENTFNQSYDLKSADKNEGLELRIMKATPLLVEGRLKRYETQLSYRALLVDRKTGAVLKKVRGTVESQKAYEGDGITSRTEFKAMQESLEDALGVMLTLVAQEFFATSDQVKATTAHSESKKDPAQTSQAEAVKNNHSDLIDDSQENL